MWAALLPTPSSPRSTPTRSKLVLSYMLLIDVRGPRERPQVEGPALQLERQVSSFARRTLPTHRPDGSRTQTTDLPPFAARASVSDCAPSLTHPLYVVRQLVCAIIFEPANDLWLHPLLLFALHTRLSGLFLRGGRSERWRRCARWPSGPPWGGSGTCSVVYALLGVS